MSSLFCSKGPAARADDDSDYLPSDPGDETDASLLCVSDATMGLIVRRRCAVAPAARRLQQARAKAVKTKKVGSKGLNGAEGRARAKALGRGGVRVAKGVRGARRTRGRLVQLSVGSPRTPKSLDPVIRSISEGRGSLVAPQAKSSMLSRALRTIEEEAGVGLCPQLGPPPTPSSGHGELGQGDGRPCFPKSSSVDGAEKGPPERKGSVGRSHGHGQQHGLLCPLPLPPRRPGVLSRAGSGRAFLGRANSGRAVLGSTSSGRAVLGRAYSGRVTKKELRIQTTESGEEGGEGEKKSPRQRLGLPRNFLSLRETDGHCSSPNAAAKARLLASASFDVRRTRGVPFPGYQGRASPLEVGSPGPGEDPDSGSTSHLERCGSARSVDWEVTTGVLQGYASHVNVEVVLPETLRNCDSPHNPVSPRSPWRTRSQRQRRGGSLGGWGLTDEGNEGSSQDSKGAGEGLDKAGPGMGQQAGRLPVHPGRRRGPLSRMAKDPWAVAECVGDRAPTLKIRDIPTWDVIMLANPKKGVRSGPKESNKVGPMRALKGEAGRGRRLGPDSPKDPWAEAELGEDGGNLWRRREFEELLVQGEV